MFFENFGSKGEMLLIVQGEDFYLFFFFPGKEPGACQYSKKELTE